MQTNKAKRKALKVTFREHCSRAEEVTSLKNKESEEVTSLKNYGRGVRTSVKNQEPALNRGLPGESRR
jgi:hypothetical protein